MDSFSKFLSKEIKQTVSELSEFIIGVDLAVEGSEVTVIKCPQCYNINSFKEGQEHPYKCNICKFHLTN